LHGETSGFDQTIENVSTRKARASLRQAQPAAAPPGRAINHI
jgi:hypothetical protein